MAEQPELARLRDSRTALVDLPSRTNARDDNLVSVHTKKDTEISNPRRPQIAEAFQGFRCPEILGIELQLLKPVP